MKMLCHSYLTSPRRQLACCLEVLGNIVFSTEGWLRDTPGPLQEKFTRAKQGIFCGTNGRARDEALRAYKDVLSSAAC